MKLKSLVAAMSIAAIFLSAASLFAAEEQKGISLVVNELKVLPVLELRRVAVGDPAIADVSVLSDTELMIMAKQPGATSLLIWDDEGQRTFTISVVEESLDRTAEKIIDLLKTAQVRGASVKKEENKVYVVGDVLNENEQTRVKDIIAPFKNVVNLVNIRERQPLVEIDVRVLEIAYDDQKNIGLDWSDALPLTYTETVGPNSGDAPKIWKVLSWERTAINAKLNFLIHDNKARTLANPKLVTLSGKEATFLVGGEIPYFTVETEGRTSIDWKEYGVNLKILPYVTSKNEIKTQIKAEVSDLNSVNAITLSGHNIPAFSTREAQTELFLKEGDTVFLAGLIKDKDSKDIERLPWLSKVPILGEMFTSRQIDNERTELVISITPRIVGEKPFPGAGSELPQLESLMSMQDAAYLSEDSPLMYYAHMIEDLIARTVVYPKSDYADDLEGTVEINLSLLADGELKDATIKRSSGFSALDEAAINAVREIAPYPSFPSQVTQQELHLIVPVVFKSYVRNE